MKTIKDLHNLAIKKSKIDLNNTLYKGIDTYLDALKDEVEEVKAEIPKNRVCYLEDELADILWNYLNSVTILERETGIHLESVIDRAFHKYAERIDAIESGISWKEIKAIQKNRLQEEQQQHADKEEQ